MIEELIQEVMIKVWQKSSAYDPSKAAASTWIFTLARNTRIDLLRRQNKYANTTSLETEDVWEDSTENGPYTFLNQKRDEIRIQEALLKLPEDQSLIIKKVYLEAKSHSEVAEELKPDLVCKTMNLLPQHHPDDNLLAEFAAGSIEYAQALAISAHLHYCPQCRSKVNELNCLGGALLALGAQTNQTADNEPLSFNQLMSAIDKRENETNTKTVIEPNIDTIPAKYRRLPKAVRKLVSEQTVNWKHVTVGLQSANLVTGQDKYGVYLQNIAAGNTVPEHDHRGSEVTVVLKGSISDEDGVYQAGDFIFKQPGDIHLPIASSNEDCLCLSIQQAPVKLTSFLGHFINPFLRINAV